MDIDCRWPGSVNDARVLSNSRVNNDLKKASSKDFSSHLLQEVLKCQII